MERIEEEEIVNEKLNKLRSRNGRERQLILEMPCSFQVVAPWRIILAGGAVSEVHPICICSTGSSGSVAVQISAEKAALQSTDYESTILFNSSASLKR